jgi:hypothetical protein
LGTIQIDDRKCRLRLRQQFAATLHQDEFDIMPCGAEFPGKHETNTLDTAPAQIGEEKRNIHFVKPSTAFLNAIAPMNNFESVPS